MQKKKKKKKKRKRKKERKKERKEKPQKSEGLRQAQKLKNQRLKTLILHCNIFNPILEVLRIILCKTPKSVGLRTA